MFPVYLGLVIFILLFNPSYGEAQPSKDINIYMALDAEESFVASNDSLELSMAECASLCSEDVDCCNFHHRKDTGKCMIGQQNECIGPQNTVSGWTYFRRGHEFNGKIYMFIALMKTWEEAKTTCQSLGMTLTSIENEETDIFVKSIVAIEYLKSIWLGGNDIATEGVWVWEESGRTFTYTGWWQSPKKPNQGISGNCLCYRQYASRPGFEWSDMQCWRKYNFVCEKLIN